MANLTITLFGNMNNSPLIFAEGFAMLGHAVKLFVTRNDLLHRPETVYPEWAGRYPAWIVDVAPVTDEAIAYETPVIDRLVAQLAQPADLVVLNDVGPALAHRLNTPHAALLTGSDLSYYANFKSLELRSITWSPEFRSSVRGQEYLRRMAGMVARQRDGIASAKVVCHPARGLLADNDAMLDAIGVTDSQRLELYVSRVHKLRERPPPRNDKLRILCGSRVVFRKEAHPALSLQDLKGTDLLLHGFARYCHLGGSGSLRIIAKGQDVDAARALIVELGVADRVQWRDEMPMHEFHEELAAADLVCDQFSATPTGLVTTDAYAFGRPVMAMFRNDVFPHRFPEPLPGYDVSSPDGVAECLLRLERDRAQLEAMGRYSRAYAERYLAPDKMMALLLKKCGL